jgi:hypothetical protein
VNLYANLIPLNAEIADALVYEKFSVMTLVYFKSQLRTKLSEFYSFLKLLIGFFDADLMAW